MTKPCPYTDCSEGGVHSHGTDEMYLPYGAEPTKQREGDQVLPQGGVECVQDVIIAAMQESKRVGTERYGQALMTFNGRKGIQDVAEEARDFFVYVTQIEQEAKATRETLIEVVAKIPFYEMQEREFASNADVAALAVDAVMGWVVGSHLMAGDHEGVPDKDVIVNILHTAATHGATHEQTASAILKTLGRSQ